MIINQQNSRASDLDIFHELGLRNLVYQDLGKEDLALESVMLRLIFATEEAPLQSDIPHPRN